MYGHKESQGKRELCVWEKDKNISGKGIEREKEERVAEAYVS